MTLPIVLPRARMRVVDDKARRLLERLALRASDVCQPERDVLAKLAAREVGGLSPSELEHTLKTRFDAVLDEVLGPLGPLPTEVTSSLEKTRATLHTSASKLAHKYEHSLSHRDAARVADVKRLQAMLQPQGKPQERVYGVSHYAARHGQRELVARVLASIEPFDVTPKELQP
jgi:hypothetical protein